MYSSPVADSIERDRAVWIAAQETISGNRSPTIRRSHTNSAQGPISAANGASLPPGPAWPGPTPKPTQTRNSRTCSPTIQNRRRDTSTRGASGSLGVTRYQ